MTPIEKRVELSLLYDFYGELLKDNQKTIFEDYTMNDYSLSEIAQEQGMSRQAVFDTVKRCTAQLEDYEARLGLISKFDNTRKIMEEIIDRTKVEYPDESQMKKALSQIGVLAADCLEVL